MKVIRLSDDDIVKMGMMQSNESVVAAELGRLREEYVRREAAMLGELQNLREERAALLSALGKFYLKDEPSSDGWKFKLDQMAFVLETEEPKEITEDHGNSN